MKYFGTFFVILLLGCVCLAVLNGGQDAAAGYGLVLGGGTTETISYGEYVELGDYLPEEKGQLVLFQYTAEWCPGCQMVEPHVQALVQEHPNVSRRKIDIESWGSPAARQMSDRFDVNYIPFFAVYDYDGESVATGNFDQVAQAIAWYGD